MSTEPQRMLLATTEGVLEGWMDEDAAAASGQLTGKGPAGSLVIDSRELLRSTARVVGAEFGEVHLKTWMALVTMFVNDGMPATGQSSSTVGRLTRLVWGPGEKGGKNTKQLLRALYDLHNARITLPGYNFATGQAADGVTFTHLLSDLYVDEAILQMFDMPGSLPLSTAGQRLGASKSGTVTWALNSSYATRLAQSELRRFDWAKAQQLRGTALAVWLVFGSPRVPYRSMFGGTSPDLEYVDMPLSVEQCQALGVHAAADSARRRTLNQAGERVCAADGSFVSIEAHGGRAMPASFLRVVRHRPQDSAVSRPYENVEQLSLTEA